MRHRSKLTIVIFVVLLTIVCCKLSADTTVSNGQIDDIYSVFPIATSPETCGELNVKHPINLHDPENFSKIFEYNPATNRYELHSKVAGEDIITPLSFTQEEYLAYTLRQSMHSYFKSHNLEEYNATSGDNDDKKDILSMVGFNFELGPAEKIFGPGGVRLQPHGSINFKAGMTYSSTDNPTMTAYQRNHWLFDFDPQIQASVTASIGDKMNFDLNYNTLSTFDFDTKKLKLVYTGKEDEILKALEAGNVSMNTTNSLIPGGTSLFGIKTELQFGKLTVGAVFSQQNSQSRTISSKGNIQMTSFEIAIDNYDVNTHFFLSHYFVDTYDKAMEKYPFIQSGIKIDNIEVWVTNKHSNYDHARNIVAFADLGEYKIGNSDFVHLLPTDKHIPHNRVNDLYDNLIEKYTGARNMSQMTGILEGLTSGQDYEKIENARKLDSTEYKLNSQLGYISLRTPLQSDEVLAVAFSYTYGGQIYQVGEFSTDRPDNANENLYLKMIKGASQSPTSIGWRLMMKNVYTISNHGIEKDKFRLDIKYLNDTIGAYLNYLTEGAIANQLLLRVENLDRLDIRSEPYPDGFFDYEEGYTVISQTGKIIFPVLEPFGEHLRKMIDDGKIADKYVYQELYDSTLTVARQAAEKNKFILTGEYKSSGNSNIDLDGFNIAKESVIVSANGIRLRENIDYVLNNGQVSIINPVYENANIQTSYENQPVFGMQRKTVMGLNLNYAFSSKFNIGATIMNMSEMPMSMKTMPGEEAINNTIFGFNTNYTAQSQWLTNIVNKLPFVELTDPSQITFNAEYARLIPGHYRNKWGGDYSYIDDFERAKVAIDLRYPDGWFLSATPSLFPEYKKMNNIEYGNNRALLAWYHIDVLFTRKTSSTPVHIKNDDNQLSNHYVREIREEELFPNKDVHYSESAIIPVFNLAFYPKERGPYNLDTLGINPEDGTLSNPQSRWGGIFRKIEGDQTDFEAHNIEYIEFWLLDPFIYDEKSSGGDLYFNLGEVSEDILKDGKKFFENGLPIDGDVTKVEKTVWGYVPKQQSLNTTFVDRKIQDTGLNGLTTDQEFNYPTYTDYLKGLEKHLPTETVEQMKQDQFSPFNDPAGDNFHHFRGMDYDAQEMSILGRYKHYNGTEGNSISSENNYSTIAKMNPDVEDINQDNTLSEDESYFQYKVSIRPNDMEVGKNFIIDKRVVNSKLKNGKTEDVAWYLFKIPLREYEKREGRMCDFRYIRFIRMFLTNFSDSIILRFGTLELVRSDWRIYSKNLSNPNLPLSNNDTQVNIATVSVEESSNKQPINYIMPPGVNRITDPGQVQSVLQNEQSLSVKITHLSPGDTRAIYKNKSLDTRQYRRFQMFVHAEKILDTQEVEDEDNELSVFLRLGSDYTNNYYEYEIPLKITPPAPAYGYNSYTDKEIVWPYSNKFDFPFELLTDLKLIRNEKKKIESGVNFYTPYSRVDPVKPMNRITVCGNPSLSEIKIIMVGIRNNSHTERSVEIWVDEMCLTEFNEDGGEAGNASLYIGFPDLGSFNFVGRKETSGFGGLDQGIMDRNIDDKQSVSISTQIELGKFFPEKAKVSVPVYFSRSEDVVNSKYNPLDKDILLKDILDAAKTKAERDSIKNFTIDKVVNRTLSFNNVHVNIVSKTPMPYDPANFTFGYSYSENLGRNATTEYDRKIDQRLHVAYLYSPMVKTWTPFCKGNEPITKNKFLSDFQLRYLPRSIALSSDISRNYYELQLRNWGSLKENILPPSFREDFYWNRTSAINWELTKNLRLDFNTGTNARINTPHVQVNKQFNMGQYEMWKDSVLMNIRDLGTPIDYNQQFSATYQFPFRNIAVLNFISGDLSYNAQYTWQRGVVIDMENVESGHIITYQRTVGLNNFTFNLLNVYNKSSFLEGVNKKYMLNRNFLNNSKQNIHLKAEKKNKKYESEISLNTGSATVIRHLLNNKRLRIIARTANGKLYNVNYKVLDDNSIQIKNRDTVNLKLIISELPPLDDLLWYKIARISARGLMSLRTFSFSYNKIQGMMIPGFRPEIGNFFGQGNTTYGNAPGLDFAFGLANEDYLEKANTNQWLVKNDMDNINPAMLNKTETFNLTALLEPFVGMKINLTANRTTTNQEQFLFMYEGLPKRFSGNFSMTTIALHSAFETSSSHNGYYSKAFETFLNNRDVIANRLENVYKPEGSVRKNSADVLIPAFLSAYMGENSEQIGLDFFPSLIRLLPNWKITYDGLIQLPIISKYFRSFALEHEYKCRYAVGAYNSFPTWERSDNGFGYIRDVTTNQLIPSSPYNVTAVSITEVFDPLIRLNSVFLNNMSLKIEYRTSRNINLNMSSYQIIEMTTTDITAGTGYRIDNFNRIIKFPKKINSNFNNELRLSFDLSFRRSRSLSRKIQDAFTLLNTGDSQIIMKGTADYNFSRLIILQAFFDRQVSNPLVSDVAFPYSKSSFGINMKVNLTP